MDEQIIKAQVKQITPLTNRIMQVILAPEQYIPYEAGQYLQIVIGDEAFCYSIANAPLGSHKYELHIRHTRNNPYNDILFAFIKEHGYVFIKVPFGSCDISRLDAHKPILFIAGGTGFAPVNAMIEHILANDDPRVFQLFWGARSQSDLYLDEKVVHWQTHVNRFDYFSALSNENKQSLSSLVFHHHKHDFQDWQMVISGPFDMVYSIRDDLVHHGVSSENMYSDAFSFEST